MTRTILIDGSHPEETRVAIVNRSVLEEYDIETANKQSIKGNIYLAKVIRVEPSLQAAFVEYGGGKHGFLAFNEIHPDYFRIPVEDRKRLEAAEDSVRPEEDLDESLGGSALAPVALEEAEPSISRENTPETKSDMSFLRVIDTQDSEAEVSSNIYLDAIPGKDEIFEEEKPVRAHTSRIFHSKYKIQEVIKSRQILLIQATKEERGNKGAALTTFISLAGRYCVLMPNALKGGGISRKITDIQNRKRLRSLLADFDLPPSMSVIVRTAGMERTKAEIKRDLDYLIKLWSDIRETTLTSTAPALIYREGDLIKRALRDLYSKDTEEIYVEGDHAFANAKGFMKLLMPSHARKIQLHTGTIPLFQKFRVQEQIDEIHNPIVQLKSGGYIVINPTEALTAVDVNSGRSNRERHIDETALNTNLEAAAEVARQVRLRDIAGLIVIDFIDMTDSKHNHQVERCLKEAMKIDRARIQIGRISMFGLLEFSRQRLRPTLLESSSSMCIHCGGTGLVRSTESYALHILRSVEDSLQKNMNRLSDRTGDFTVYAPTPVTLYLLNTKKEHLCSLESKFGLQITFSMDDSIITPDFRTSLTDILPPLPKTTPSSVNKPHPRPSGPKVPVSEATAPSTTKEGFSKRRRKGRTSPHPSSPESENTSSQSPASAITPTTPVPTPSDVPSIPIQTRSERLPTSENTDSSSSNHKKSSTGEAPPRRKSRYPLTNNRVRRDRRTGDAVGAAAVKSNPQSAPSTPAPSAPPKTPSTETPRAREALAPEEKSPSTLERRKGWWQKLLD